MFPDLDREFPDGCDDHQQDLPKGLERPELRRNGGRIYRDSTLVSPSKEDMVELLVRQADEFEDEERKARIILATSSHDLVVQLTVAEPQPDVVLARSEPVPIIDLTREPTHPNHFGMFHYSCIHKDCTFATSDRADLDCHLKANHLDAYNKVSKSKAVRKYRGHFVTRHQCAKCFMVFESGKAFGRHRDYSKSCGYRSRK